MHWICYTEVCGLYAAVARLAGLAPVDRPVVVLREGRLFDGCREAFTSGLVLGAPARQVLRDAPRAATVEFALIVAEPAARNWWEQCLAHTPYIEPVELHQLFLGLPTPSPGITKTMKDEIAVLHARAAEHGFVAFTGVGLTKLVARAAALACKEGWLLRRLGQGRPSAAPTTLTFVESGEEARFLAPLPAAYLPASREVQRRLVRLGVRSIGEVARIPEGEWQRQFGAQGRQLAQWSRGADPEQVKPCYPPRTLSRRVEFTPQVRDRDQIGQVLVRSAGILARALEAKGEGCQQVGLLLESVGRTPIQVSRTLAKLQQAPWPLQQALQLLLGQALPQVSKEGVTAVTTELGVIGPMPWKQLNLWDDSGRNEREERLQQALTLLHERFPARVVGLGPQGETSWREQMLEFSDPYRWAPRGVVDG